MVWYWRHYTYETLCLFIEIFSCQHLCVAYILELPFRLLRFQFTHHDSIYLWLECGALHWVVVVVDHYIGLQSHIWNLDTQCRGGVTPSNVQAETILASSVSCFPHVQLSSPVMGDLFSQCSRQSVILPLQWSLRSHSLRLEDHHHLYYGSHRLRLGDQCSGNCSHSLHL